MMITLEADRGVTTGLDGERFWFCLVVGLTAVVVVGGGGGADF